MKNTGGCRSLTRFVRPIILIVAGVLLLVVLYGTAAIVLSILPVNREWRSEADHPVDIYFISNGVHFDIVLPVKNSQMNWEEDILEDFTGVTESTYVGFGWGDKGFYLTTPEWADLTFPTAFKALFLKSESALHITLYPSSSVNSSLKNLKISQVEYQALAGFISSSFKRGENGQTIRIKGFSYGDQDSFYEAERSYNLFYTCNTWVNQAFKKSGLRACVWTPFDKGLLFQYRNVK